MIIVIVGCGILSNTTMDDLRSENTALDNFSKDRSRYLPWLGKVRSSLHTTCYIHAIDERGMLTVLYLEGDLFRTR